MKNEWSDRTIYKLYFIVYNIYHFGIIDMWHYSDGGHSIKFNLLNRDGKMKAIIIDADEYEKIPLTLCDAIWKIANKNCGVKMISRETNEEIDEIHMVGLLIDALRRVLEDAGEK